MTKNKQKKSRKKTKKGSRLVKKSGEKSPRLKIPDMQDIPVYDFFEDHQLDTDWGLVQCIEDLVYSIEGGYYLMWEGVVREEQGLPLTDEQEEVLGELISFSDDDFVLYINDMPRPSEPWFETVKKVVPKLILDPFKTFEGYDEAYHEGWLDMVDCLEEHARALSLPEGVASPVEVIPPDIRHRLWLQYCFETLSGLGQAEELTLVEEEQKSVRVEGFIETLKECKESVEYFDLTLEQLLKWVELPPRDEKILVESMLQELGMTSPSEKLHDVL